MLPQKLKFSQPLDFARVTLMLSILFKEVVSGFEPRGKRGNFTFTKDAILVSIKTASKSFKKRFNTTCFYVEDKRVLLI